MLAFILGTRPEIIKMAPLIRECEKQDTDYILVHTGQHYSYEMDEIFFEELELPEANYMLGAGSGTDAEQIGKILIGAEAVLAKETPDIVLVEGDTNSVFAGACAAAKLHMHIGHVEAGLRSYDRYMPEEINRVLTDHVSDFLFAPTADARNNLLREGISARNIFVAGNTVVDAVYQNLGIAQKRVDILGELDLKGRSYFLATSHRQENVDNKARLSGIIEGLSLLHYEFDVPVIFPAHPRTYKRMAEFNLTSNEIAPISPRGFLEFLLLEANAKLVITDSGGVQEEACTLRVPCITLRNTTERPETLVVGSNVLVGTEPDRILAGARAILSKPCDWINPFGEGKSAPRIMSILKSSLEACGITI